MFLYALSATDSDFAVDVFPTHQLDGGSLRSWHRSRSSATGRYARP
jgi:hypothetical protein